MDDFQASGSLSEEVAHYFEMEGTEDLEQISLVDETEGDTTEEETEMPTDEGHEGGFDTETAVDGEDDLRRTNFNNISSDEIMRFHFPDTSVAFMFYNWFGSVKGFAARKSKVMRNCNGDITQQTFLCNREGKKREPKQIGETSSRKREPKPNFRCGCEARMMVHVEANSGRWYIKYFNDVHNHTMMEPKFTKMLPAHRKISEHVKFQVKSMTTVGIKIPHVYGFVASQAGGYDNLGFLRRDLYNEQFKPRRFPFSDAKVALDYLDGMKSNDDMLFWKHTVDKEGRLEHLFWCDGVSRRDFSVFGDVLAFDATYRKNKYMCPFVVFSGVNHHNQSIVFATAIVGNETEETYVWVLEQFVEAMSGKCPVSVITDGDVAMRNAIRRVFPNAHHRLCAWHLIRNATSNVKNPKFVSRFKQCMMGDYDTHEFKRKWSKLVSDFGLTENNWVKDLYEKRGMWATAHIRGKFFAGFRTTSRCEGLHSEFGKYVNVRNNLLEFLKHFCRWVASMRHREVEADFYSSYGEPDMQTHLQHLERSAANIYTKEIFLLFRAVIERASTCKVDGVKQTTGIFLYRVSRYGMEGIEWQVTFCQSNLRFCCSCERLESFGIPCEHLVIVMVFLNIKRLPETVVLSRWTKTAKDSIRLSSLNTSSTADPSFIAEHGILVESCRRMTDAAYECKNPDYMRRTVAAVNAHTKFLQAVHRGDNIEATDSQIPIEGSLRNPPQVRTKGCGGPSSSSQNKGKQTVRRVTTCGMCGRKGHNRKSCQARNLNDGRGFTQEDHIAEEDSDDEDVNEECDYATIDMVMLPST